MEKIKTKKTTKRTDLSLHVMLIPGVVLVFLFSYVPLFLSSIAFEKYVPSKGIFGSPWIWFQNFVDLVKLPNTFQILFNTVFIAFMKIIALTVVPVIFALLLNEVKNVFYKRITQTIVYFPHFLSWIIMSGILIDILSPSGGLVNNALQLFGIQPVFFLGKPGVFPYVIVWTDVWKEFGFSAIIYLAALTSVDPSLYQAAVVDGAGRWKQTIHVTIPGMLPIILLMLTLSMGNILNAGFDQIFNLYSPSVYSTGDILDTFIYRMGMVDAQYGVATAVGLFKSVVSFFFIFGTLALAGKYSDYRVF
jgi:putative aldouronate transport system permease protein